MGHVNVRKRGKMGNGVVDGNACRKGDAYTIRSMRIRGKERETMFPYLWRL